MKCFPIPDGKIKAFPIKTSENPKKQQKTVEPEERIVEKPVYRALNEERVVERIIERPVYQNQPEERIVERIVEKPVYVNNNGISYSNLIKIVGVVIVSAYVLNTLSIL